MATAHNVDERPKWLRLLHRVGYVTTALVLAELLGIGSLATWGWLQERQMRAGQIEESRTHDAPLQADKSDIVGGSAAYLLDQLPPLKALGGDGIRFVAMPSFNRSHFAVAIYMPSASVTEAQGVLARYDWQNKYAPLGQRHFTMPAAAYRSLATKLDKLTDGWPGDPGLCLDGTPTAFERVRGRRITSGIGNCNQHYEAVAQLMWSNLAQFAPGDDLPTRGDWEPSQRD